MEPGKRERKPTIRGMQITVEDIMWLVSGMTFLKSSLILTNKTKPTSMRH
ncbi:MAG: hypothetical protein ACOX2D_00655 [Fermentimonas sp.]